jgi:hypothetical protein
MALATAIPAAYDPDLTYNGWANKPTWLVHLWLTNESETDAEVRHYAACHLDGHHAPCCEQLGEHATHHPDDWLRTFVEAYLEDREGVAPRGLGWDLLSWTLSMVEWPEIAEAFAPEPVATCPACGEPIDYCGGHGEIGDPVGSAILVAHDAGDHDDCHPEGCDDTR